MVLCNKSFRYKPLAAAFLVLFPFAQVLVCSPATVQSFPPLNTKKNLLKSKLTAFKNYNHLHEYKLLLLICLVEHSISHDSNPGEKDKEMDFRNLCDLISSIKLPLKFSKRQTSMISILRVHKVVSLHLS